MSIGEKVNVITAGAPPEDYHCRCDYCMKVIGELRRPEGTYYSRLERREYYDPSERGPGGHVAKTPLHVARWAIQQYTAPGDWVLDPTIGAGTTAVEALTQGRNAAGMEIQFADVLRANVDRNLAPGTRAIVAQGDARELAEFIRMEGVPRPALVLNNPPYSGDEHAGTGKMNGDRAKTWTTSYQDGLPNLAFLDEGPAYWDAIRGIYRAAADHLLPGGRFVVAVKDMMRKRAPFLLHRDLCAILQGLGLEFQGTAFLKHYPGTLFLHTYEKRYGIRPPLYQTISVFRKPAA